MSCALSRQVNPHIFLAVGDRFREVGKELSTQKGQRETGWDCHMGPLRRTPLRPGFCWLQGNTHLSMPMVDPAEENLTNMLVNWDYNIL